MKFQPTALQGCYIITPDLMEDNRGWFSRVFCKKEFAAIGHDKEWVQLNHSFTRAKGSLRGMHFQYPPFREIKMVRCIAGGVYDVVIDLREGSSTFLQSTGVELSAANRQMLYIPEGFAHGFQTLVDNTELLYHHTAFYEPGHEGAIRYDEPLAAIKWPLQATEISERDRQHAYLTENFKGI